MAERHPILPEDFDFRFWQCAPPDLIADPWLEGNETLEFLNMHPQIGLLRAKLPDVRLIARIKRPNEPVIEQPLALDGVHIDFRRGASKVVLTWRTSFAYEPENGEIDLLFSKAPADIIWGHKT